MEIGASTRTTNTEPVEPKKENGTKLQDLQVKNVYQTLKMDNVSITNSNNRFANNENIKSVMDGRTYISKGFKGDDVKLIQEALKDLGFNPGDNVDGKFGGQTVTAVKNFQSSRGLPETGTIDVKTMKELSKVAPPVGKKLWDKNVLSDMVTVTKDNTIAPSNELKDGKKAKIVVDLSEHRLFLYNDDNTLKKVYSVATGKSGHADGRGGKTHTGIKIINYKDFDPSVTANKLWPETKGRAFGTKLLDLSWYDLDTKKKTANGEEIHGTYARSSVGTDASHGCMRMQNEDIEEVFAQVKTGDLVKIQD